MYTQTRCFHVTVILSCCYSGGVFQDPIFGVHLWDYPRLTTYASCQAYEVATTGIFHGMTYSRFGYFFCEVIRAFGGEVFTNRQLYYEVFPRVFHFSYPIFWQSPRLDTPLGFWDRRFVELP